MIALLQLNNSERGGEGGGVSCSPTNLTNGRWTMVTCLNQKIVESFINYIIYYISFIRELSYRLFKALVRKDFFNNDWHKIFDVIIGCYEINVQNLHLGNHHTDTDRRGFYSFLSYISDISVKYCPLNDSSNELVGCWRRLGCNMVVDVPLIGCVLCPIVCRWSGVEEVTEIYFIFNYEITSGYKMKWERGLSRIVVGFI